MAFELLQWLLIGLPVAFALGWMASRFDLRQWKREQRETPRAYFKGLNLLLNEQQDKAIDAFIEAVQNDPDTTELHFALGNLFRRRGEFERAVRVHQHLLKRADLPAADRERAQHALAQDFMKAGLFDRAEEAWHALEGTPFDTEARLALLSLHERSRDWRAAIERGAPAGAARHRLVRVAHRPLLVRDRRGGRRAPAARRGRRGAWPRRAPPRRPPRGRCCWPASGWRGAASTPRRCASGASCRRSPGDVRARRRRLRRQRHRLGRDGGGAASGCCALHRRMPSLELIDAIAALDPDPAQQRARLCAFLSQQPQLSAALRLLQLADTDAGPLSAEESRAVADAVGRAAQPLQRYRCAACGFEAQHYFWQCPGCMSWDSYPPQRLEVA